MSGGQCQAEHPIARSPVLLPVKYWVLTHTGYVYLLQTAPFFCQKTQSLQKPNTLKNLLDFIRKSEYNVYQLCIFDERVVYA